MTGDAQKLLDSEIRKRKKELRNKFKNMEEPRLSKKETLDFLSKNISTSDIEMYFRIIINWTRHAGLIGYNSDSDEIFLMSRDKY